MPAKSKAQTNFFRMVRAYQDGSLDTSKMTDQQVSRLRKTANSISKTDASVFAKTKDKKLPKRVVNEQITFSDFLFVDSLTETQQ